MAHLTEPLLSKVTKPAAIKPPCAWTASNASQRIEHLVDLHDLVVDREGEMRRIVGPSGGGQSLELPRASGREGSTRSLVAASQKTPLSVKRELYRREPCERKGLNPKLSRDPFESVVRIFSEAIFRHHPSRRSPEHGDRRYRAPQSSNQLPDITPCGRARGNLVEFRCDSLDGSQVSPTTHARATKAAKPDGQYVGPGSSPPRVFFPRLGEVLPFAVQRAPGIFN
jgi:hypothetical protein